MRIVGLGLIVLGLSFQPASAAIRRCKVDGVIVYSDTACMPAPEVLARRPPPIAEEVPAAPVAETLTAPPPPPPASTASAGVDDGMPGVAEPGKSVPETRPGDSKRIYKLLNGKVQLQLLESFRFLDAERAQRVLVDHWGNPPEQVEGVLGMVMPAFMEPEDEGSWGAVITYAEDGRVSDRDADKIDFSALLKDMQASLDDGNEEREQEGYPTVQLVGWAEPPRYQRDGHRIYWAKDLVIGGDALHTLNYSVRVLGRDGVLELNAVAETNQMAEIKRRMEQVVGFAEFTSGHRYEDHREGIDPVAGYGLAALVTGGIAAKKGAAVGLVVLLKLLIKLAIKFWKPILVGFAALGGLAGKLLRKS